MSKNFLVVGGSSGIGLEIALQLIKQQHSVWVASRSFSDLLLKNKIHHIQLDVTQSLEGKLESLPEKLHGLAYCPGTIQLKPFQNLKEEDFLNDFEVNVLGAVRMLKATMKNLKNAEGASVLMFSTVAAKLGMNFHASISVAKSGVEGLTKTLAAEWAPAKIRVNALAPSLTDTPLAARILSNEEKKESAGKRHPVGRVGTAEEIAALAVFLLSDQSTWITGQVIGIDGGMSSLKP